MSAVLELEGLTAGYNGSPVLRDVNLTVRPGEIVALLGANGAGKTSTLRSIVGMLKPMRGRVIFGGGNLAGQTADARARQGIAHVPEEGVIDVAGVAVMALALGLARRRTVGYTLAYPPGHRPGDRLPLVVMLHGYGAGHANALPGMSPAQALALRTGGTPLAPMAMVTADGGGGYWNPHPGDDPMAMLTREVIPMCRRLGLGRPPHRIGAMGISMGGYGVLLLAEKHSHGASFA